MNDDGRRGRVCAVMTSMHGGLGELDDGLASGARALEIAGRLGDLRLRILATSFLSQVRFFRGDHARVVDLTTDNLSALPTGWALENFEIAAPPSVHDRGYLIMSLAELGRFAEAAGLQPKRSGSSHRCWMPTPSDGAHLTDGTVHLLRGEWAQARPGFERAMAAIRAGNLPLLLSLTVAFSARNMAQLGDASEALSRLQEGEQLVERQVATGYVGNLGWLYPWLGRTALLLGRLDDAQRLGTRALEASPHQAGFAAHALHLLGEVATHPDRFDAERGETIFAGRWYSPKRAACVRWSPTARSASASFTGVAAPTRTRRSISPARPHCTARWTCRSGFRRPRPRCKATFVAAPLKAPALRR